MATRGSLAGDYMVRRTARKMKRAAAKKTATKRLAQRYEAPTGSLKGREARAEERFRELVAWHMLQAWTRRLRVSSLKTKWITRPVRTDERQLSGVALR